MSTEALFTIAKKQKQPKRPSVDEYRNKCCIPIQWEKKNEIVIHATT